jgi:phenylacetate-CoA ligase
MQIEQVIMAMPEVGQNYLIVLESDGPKEDLKIKVEIRDEYFVEDMRVLHGLQKKIARRLQSETLVTPKVELVQSESLPAGEGKANRVLDLREK